MAPDSLNATKEPNNEQRVNKSIFEGGENNDVSIMLGEVAEKHGYEDQDADRCMIQPVSDRIKKQFIQKIANEMIIVKLRCSEHVQRGYIRCIVTLFIIKTI